MCILQASVCVLSSESQFFQCHAVHQQIACIPVPSMKTQSSVVFLNNFCGATDTPVLDFWWRLSWVSKPGWIPCLHALLPACNEFLRLISGATPADCIEVGMAAEPFRSTYPKKCLQVLVLLFWLPGIQVICWQTVFHCPKLKFRTQTQTEV